MAPKPKQNTERTYVFLSPEILEELRKEADSKGTSISGLIRMIVMEHVNKKK